MTGLLEKPTLRLSNKKLHGRVINATANFLRDRLSVPNVYLNPKIHGIPAADVLAVDRAGSGDLHVVEIKSLVALRTRAELRSLLAEVMPLPFHYKYIALPEVLNPVEGLSKFAEYAELFDETGIGRIGILSFDSSIIDSASTDGVSAIRMIVRPERFRVVGKALPVIEKFLAKTKPDMEVRI